MLVLSEGTFQKTTSINVRKGVTWVVLYLFFSPSTPSPILSTMSLSLNANVTTSRLQWLAGLSAGLEPTEDVKYLRKASRDTQIVAAYMVS